MRGHLSRPHRTAGSIHQAQACLCGCSASLAWPPCGASFHQGLGGHQGGPDSDAEAPGPQRGCSPLSTSLPDPGHPPPGTPSQLFVNKGGLVSHRGPPGCFSRAPSVGATAGGQGGHRATDEGSGKGKAPGSPPLRPGQKHRGAHPRLGSEAHQCRAVWTRPHVHPRTQGLLPPPGSAHPLVAPAALRPSP